MVSEIPFANLFNVIIGIAIHAFYAINVFIYLTKPDAILECFFFKSSIIQFNSVYFKYNDCQNRDNDIQHVS